MCGEGLVERESRLDCFIAIALPVLIILLAVGDDLWREIHSGM